MLRCLFLSLLLIIGCGTDEHIFVGPCTPSEEKAGYCTREPEDAGAPDASDAGTGGAGGGEQSSLCPGPCVPPAPLGWFGPALFWFGPADRVPDCPESAPHVGYEGFADLAPLPATCAACLCDPPAEASCALPLIWSASTAMCPGDVPGAIATSFAAPDGWDGACTAENAVAAGATCDGQPCVQSLSIEAPVVATSACTPRRDQPVPIPDVQPWGTRAKACLGGAFTTCDATDLCMPAPPEPGQPSPDGFATCIYSPDDHPCPNDYTEKHVFYEGLDDTRDCTPCGCGDATGASCTVMASIYSDDACRVPLASNPVSSTVAFCGVMPPGVGLGSKAAVITDVEPGTCAPSGGEPVGDVEPSEPSTVCCVGV
jgi:hypothetical protein